MKQSVLIVVITSVTVFATGCATKKYVKQTVDPVSGKLDQVAQQTNQQGQTLDQTKQAVDQTKQSLDQTRTSLQASIDKNETDINATNERAVSAGNRADDVSKKADQLGHDLGDLRNTVANLDDYKQVAETTVNFKFGSDKLSAEAKTQLDQMITGQNHYKRFFKIGRAHV